MRINIPFEDFATRNNESHAIVKASFISKDEKNIDGYFIIDTGTTSNVLFNTKVESLNFDRIEASNESTVISSIKDLDSVLLNVKFVLGNVEFSELFHLIDTDITEIIDDKYDGYNILGIIGSTFLLKHGFVLDFNKNSLYSSIVPREDINEADYQFIHLRFNRATNVPIIYWVSQDNSTLFPCLLDTGADNSVTTKFILDKLGYKYEETGTKNDLILVGGDIHAEENKIAYKLLGENKGADKYLTQNFDANINVTSDRELIIDTEEILVSAILGYNDIRAMKMIIDFKNLFAYISK